MFSIYPNPAVDELNLEIEIEQGNNYTFVISDINGREVMSINATGNIMHIDITTLENGVYLIKLLKNNHSIDYAKFVKTK